MRVLQGCGQVEGCSACFRLFRGVDTHVRRVCLPQVPVRSAHRFSTRAGFEPAMNAKQRRGGGGRGREEREGERGEGRGREEGESALESVFGAKVFELDDAVRPLVCHGCHQLVRERLVFGALQPAHAVPQIQRVVHLSPVYTHQFIASFP
jgi:hypothetical protein